MRCNILSLHLQWPRGWALAVLPAAAARKGWTGRGQEEVQACLRAYNSRHTLLDLSFIQCLHRSPFLSPTVIIVFLPLFRERRSSRKLVAHYKTILAGTWLYLLAQGSSSIIRFALLTQLTMSITVAALSTTFTPAATCTNLVFSSPIYKVWLNEPVPASGTTMSDCFPGQWLQGYASASPSSSIAPLMSPLVCPSGWTTAFRTSTSYIACCPSSYALHYPDTTVDTNRPAYGGTCFSDVTAGQTLVVTLFGDSSIVEVRTVTSTTDGGQAFAHPIDGIMIQVGTQATASPTGLDLGSSLPAGVNTAPSAGQLPAGAASTNTVSDTTAGVASQAPLSTVDIAGIVVGACGAIALLTATVVFLLYRRSHRKIQHMPADQCNTYDNDIPPPTPAKDICTPLSHACSTHTNPTYFDEKRMYPHSGTSTPQRPDPTYGYHNQHQNSQRRHQRDVTELEGWQQEQRYEMYSQARGPGQDAAGRELFEIYSPTRESRTHMGMGMTEMDGSRPGGYDYTGSSKKSSVQTSVREYPGRF